MEIRYSINWFPFFFTYMIRYPCNIRKQRFTELKEVTFQLGNGEQFELIKFVLLDMWAVENNNFAYEVDKYFERLNILMYLLTISFPFCCIYIIKIYKRY